jgi:hypothetical protein
VLNCIEKVRVDRECRWKGVGKSLFKTRRRSCFHEREREHKAHTSGKNDIMSSGDPFILKVVYTFFPKRYMDMIIPSSGQAPFGRQVAWLPSLPNLHPLLCPLLGQ